MKMNKLIQLAKDITINVKGEEVILISKTEVIDFIIDTYGKEFTTRSSAKKLTNISYLGDVNASAKIKKGLKQDYHTYVMYLSPYKNIFGNVCANGTHCHKPCLNTSGRVKMDVKEFKILRARYFRTMLFYINRDFFNAWLFAEIESAKNKYKNFMVRLNGTSDLSPKLFKVGNTIILDAFKDVQFYDYTKIPNRLELLSQYSNYHITFSFDGYNMKECLFAQAMGVNVSVVIDGDMPEMFLGKPMFTMDDTDLRPLDEHRGCFGYLKLKQTLNKEYDTKFIVKL